MKFRKKPVVIEAFQWFEKMGEVGGVVRDYDREGFQPRGKHRDLFKIKTLEGKHEVSNGDWIITGVKGEKYPCKPDTHCCPMLDIYFCQNMVWADKMN